MIEVAFSMIECVTRRAVMLTPSSCPTQCLVGKMVDKDPHLGKIAHQRDCPRLEGQLTLAQRRLACVRFGILRKNGSLNTED